MVETVSIGRDAERQLLYALQPPLSASSCVILGASNGVNLALESGVNRLLIMPSAPIWVSWGVTFMPPAENTPIQNSNVYIISQAFMLDIPNFGDPTLNPNPPSVRVQNTGIATTVAVNIWKYTK